MSYADPRPPRVALRYVLGGLALFVGPALWASEVADPTSPASERAGYSAGYQFGRNLDGLAKDGAKIDLKAVFRGVLDALSGAEPSYSAGEMQAALDALAKAGGDAAARQPGDTTSPRAREGGFKDDFAALNARRPGVVSLPSGVQYEVLRAGSGRQPQPGDTVAIQYRGILTNGVVFDTTYDDDEPLHLKIGEIVVPGLREALLLMQENARWRVVVPPAMGFGKAGNNQLRRRDLIYEVELLSVEATAKDSDPAAAR